MIYAKFHCDLEISYKNLKETNILLIYETTNPCIAM